MATPKMKATGVSASGALKVARTKAAARFKPPKSRADMRPVDKAFIHSVMFELGILPIEDPTLDMRVPLRTIDPAEARVIKRKFRKMWRKLMKAQLGHPNEKQAEAKTKAAHQRLGVGKHVPSRAERLERKRLVYERIWNEYIVPMLVKFEDPERLPKLETTLDRALRDAGKAKEDSQEA